MAIDSNMARCFSLVFLGLFVSPLSLIVLCLSTLKNLIYPSSELCQNRIRHNTSQRTILVTGVGMAKGLTLARAFYLCGHRVIGADFEDHLIPCSGRFLKGLLAFYRLPRPCISTHTKAYINSLVQIIKDEGVDLWVSCSGVASAIEDAQAKEVIEYQTLCKCIQFDVATTSLLHEKNKFMRACLERRLSVPETHEVTSGDQIMRFLSSSALLHPSRKHILKPIGVDDVNRGDMTLLPLPSDLMTREHVFRLPISPSTPWILQQFIQGGEEYCTHTLVVRGELKCFVACPSSELLMHYTPLPQEDVLWHDMREFSIQFLERFPAAESMTGHLSFDFMVMKGNKDGSKKTIYAIECNPRAHTAVVLFAQQGPEMRDMVRAYLSAIEEPQDSSLDANVVCQQKSGWEKMLVTPPRVCRSRYWLGNDIVSLLLYPILRLITGSAGFMDVLASSLIFLGHLCTWKEGSFELWDPLPALVLYNIYWPLTILSAWWQGRHWSRINVSTTKMFAC
ncbi:carbamoylphosphate synthase large subunit [Xylaria sp. FL1042]|nr:carbamoylphosphate synthase large subunit [Xylaria sp. FL1042]